MNQNNKQNNSERQKKVEKTKHGPFERRVLFCSWILFLFIQFIVFSANDLLISCKSKIAEKVSKKSERIIKWNCQLCLYVEMSYTYTYVICIPGRRSVVRERDRRTLELNVHVYSCERKRCHSFTLIYLWLFCCYFFVLFEMTADWEEKLTKNEHKIYSHTNAYTKKQFNSLRTAYENKNEILTDCCGYTMHDGV